MKNSVQKMATAGMVAVVAIAAIMIVQLQARQAAQVAGDFRHAQTAEIRDAQGTVLLRGTFAVTKEDAGEDQDGEVERKAPLTAVSGGAMTGEAEVEYREDQPALQEVEFTAIGVAAGATVTFVIDGKTVTTATADKNGKAEAEIDVKAVG